MTDRDPASPSFLVPHDGTFTVAGSPTAPPADAPTEDECEARLVAAVDRIRRLQRVLYAHDRHALLLVFQAMDAAGKDSTIRHVMTGVNPAGFQVVSFKQPSREELDHDFLWRTARRLPERGRIGVFNRSYYEEVLVVRVHPEYLDGQHLPGLERGPEGHAPESFWEERFESIREHERHLARSGTVIRKFWLNVSLDEQKRRFLRRLDRPEKHWKFSAGDVAERAHWPSYMAAYEEALRATARPWAPWYAIPADSKRYMRMVVAEIVADTLEGLDLHYPTPDADDIARFDEMRALLEGGA